MFDLQITHLFTNNTELLRASGSVKETNKPPKLIGHSTRIPAKSPSSLIKRIKDREGRKETRKSDSFVYENGCSKNSNYEISSPDENFVHQDPLSIQLPIDAKSCEIGIIDIQEKVVHLNAHPMTKKSPSAKILSVCDLKELIRLGNNCSKRESVRSFPHNNRAFVELEDIFKILHDEALSNKVVNAHAELLTLEYNNRGGRKFKILDSTMWKYIRSADLVSDRSKRDRQLYVDKVLAEHGNENLNFLIFPISTNENKGATISPDHWTLLVYDILKPEWIFYNSKMISKKIDDPFAQDALRVKNYVETQIREQNKEWEDEFIPISDRASFDAKAEDPVDYPFKVCVDFPQQKDKRNDCGFYMCYAMEAIAKGETIPDIITHAQLQKYKASLVARFIRVKR